MSLHAGDTGREELAFSLEVLFVYSNAYKLIYTRYSKIHISKLVYIWNRLVEILDLYIETE